MNLLKNIDILLIVLLKLFFSTIQPGVARDEHKPDLLLDARVAHFELKSGTMLDGLSLLSTQQLSLTIGFEDVLKAKHSDPPLQEPFFSLDLEDTTVRAILDQLCANDSRYTWSRDQQTVNIYPRDAEKDPAYLPSRRLPQLQLSDISSADEALFSLARQLPLPQEQVAISQLGGSISYSKPWTTTFENTTVRQALNRIAEQLGTRGGWLFSGSREFRFFTFYSHSFQRITFPVKK